MREMMIVGFSSQSGGVGGHLSRDTLASLLFNQFVWGLNMN